MALDLIWEALGISWDWPGDHPMGWTALPPRLEQCFARIQGSMYITAKRERRSGFSGPYYQSNNCLIQGTFMSELLDLRIRKVTVEQ